MTATDYDARVRTQIEQFRAPGALSKLPAIYRYWMQKHIVPRVVAVFGTRSIFDMYFNAAKSAATRGRAVVYSLGAGDCTIEMRLAERLKTAKSPNVRIVCLELSPVRLARAKAAAAQKGVADLMEFVEADLNRWNASQEVDVFIAHHCLHHVQELESLYSAMAAAMDERSVLVTADMIGRNGHRRWPETLHWIEHLWRIMPDRYKFSFQFRKHHEQYLDWDSAASGFEGIRAQEVLPLLLDRFDYDGFLGFGGIIDPFVDRSYGHNLKPGNPADTAFIDFVEDLNQTLMEAGAIKPTMMFGVFKKGAGAQSHFRALSPEFCVRLP